MFPAAISPIRDLCMRHIIIDGYNVIRADPHLLALERQSLDEAREVLIRTLASSPRLANDRVTVVFDAAMGARPHAHHRLVGRIDVVYSATGQSADDLIMAQAETLAGNGTVIVVSNDREIRDRCRAAGCQVTGSENLLGQLPGRPRHLDRDEDEVEAPTLSTAKRGNPRRAPRGRRRVRDVRF
jgi:predicted RNA-binding protein with PIN domain